MSTVVSRGVAPGAVPCTAIGLAVGRIGVCLCVRMATRQWAGRRASPCGPTIVQSRLRAAAVSLIVANRYDGGAVLVDLLRRSAALSGSFSMDSKFQACSPAVIVNNHLAA